MLTQPEAESAPVCLGSGGAERCGELGGGRRRSFSGDCRRPRLLCAAKESALTVAGQKYGDHQVMMRVAVHQAQRQPGECCSHLMLRKYGALLMPPCMMILNRSVCKDILRGRLGQLACSSRAANLVRAILGGSSQVSKDRKNMATAKRLHHQAGARSNAALKDNRAATTSRGASLTFIVAESRRIFCSI